MDPDRRKIHIDKKNNTVDGILIVSNEGVNNEKTQQQTIVNYCILSITNAFINVFIIIQFTINLRGILYGVKAFKIFPVYLLIAHNIF